MVVLAASLARIDRGQQALELHAARCAHKIPPRVLERTGPPVHTNVEIAQVFEEIAELLALDDANPFRIRAYANAARTIAGRSVELADIVAAGKPLPRIAGVGGDLAAKILEIRDTGDCALLRELRRTHPKGLVELLRVPGLGPKRLKRLYQELKIDSPAQLQSAARAGHIRSLTGFGVESEKRLLAAVEAFLGREQRVRCDIAMPQAEAIVRSLRAAREALQVEIAGSARRRRETVGDVDIVVTAHNANDVTRRFVGNDAVDRVLARGTTRSSVVLRSGLQVDLRVVEPESFGAAMLYFTGSKAHNIALRRIARDRGLKVNEYGIWRGKRRVAGDTEASMYAAIDLPWIEPELREDRGEIAAAREGSLPRLVERADLRGDLHAHTEASDGRGTLAQMAAAAHAAGLEYLAITDHSKGLKIARGLDSRRLAEQIDAIDVLNASSHGATLLKGIEVEILEDGRLDLPASVLERLDLVVGAVHSAFGLSRARQTDRILRAIDSPCFSILAHPTGRLIGEREAYDIDLERVIRHAHERGCFLELNAQPQRLDLPDLHCRAARDAGVLIALSSDAHDPSQVGSLDWGVGQARRGWLETRDVLNTRSLKEIQPLLSATMTGTSR